jgi:anti-sigma B factor antagonist
VGARVEDELTFGVDPDPKQPGGFVLRGELDMATAPILLTAVGPMLQDPANDVVLDVRRLSFVDSTGISALIRISTRLEGRTLTLVGPAENVARVLKLVRADAFPNVRIVWDD